MSEDKVLGFLADHLPFLESDSGLHPQPLPDRLKFVRLLGRGGTGEVWLADDLQLERPVAIKTLRRDRLKAGAVDNLRTEARTIAGLLKNRRIGQNVVNIYDWISRQDNCYLVMEYIDGGTFGRRVKRFGPLHWFPAVRYITEIGDALTVVHEQELIHRDIKPENILWSISDDRAVLSDFGIAAQRVDWGEACGTTGYVAPEVHYGRNSPGSDVFALAASLFYLLTAEPPFPAKNWMDGMRLASRGLDHSDPRLAEIPALIRDGLLAALHPLANCRPTLPDFVQILRTSAAESLGESVAPEKAADNIDVSVDVWSDGVEMPPEASPPDTGGSVPVYRMQTGCRVTARFHSRSGGYLTLLNVGSSGNASVIPLSEQNPSCPIEPGGARDVTFVLNPPAGTDQLVGILTGEDPQLAPEQWLHFLDSRELPEEPAEVYRDLQLLSTNDVPLGERWTSVSVLLIHQ